MVIIYLKTMEDPESLVSANEIVPNLWLGNEGASQNENFLRKINASVIINTTEHIPNKWEKTTSLTIEYYRIPINDPGPVNQLDQIDNVTLYNEFPKVLKFIHDKLQNGQVILVHCHAGVQRSASVVLAYLMTYVYTDGSKKDRLMFSLRHLLRNRPIVFYSGTETSFKPALTQYIIEL